MPKTKKSQPGYTMLKEHPQRLNRKEKNDCGVMALAIACGVSYAKAHTALKKQGRKNRSGTWPGQMKRAALSLGYQLIEIEVTTKTIGRLPYDLSQSKQFGRFIVKTSSHFAAIIDGKVEDWSGGRGLRIEYVYRVVEC